MLLCGSDWVRALHGLKRKHAGEEKVSSVYNFMYLDYLVFLLIIFMYELAVWQY